MSNAGLLFLAGVEVAKIGRWRSWRWFTGLDDTLTGSCCGWSFFDACSAILERFEVVDVGNSGRMMLREVIFDGTPPFLFMTR